MAGGLPDGVLNVVQAEGPAAFEGWSGPSTKGW